MDLVARIASREGKAVGSEKLLGSTTRPGDYTSRSPSTASCSSALCRPHIRLEEGLTAKKATA